MAAVVQAPLETTTREAKGKPTESTRPHSPTAFPFDDALNDIMKARHPPQSSRPAPGAAQTRFALLPRAGFDAASQPWIHPAAPPSFPTRSTPFVP